MDLSDDQFRTLVLLARKALWAGSEVKRKLQSLGVNITPANFYSNIPLVEDIEFSFEYAEVAAGRPPYEASGLFDRQQISEFLEAIDAYANEFSPPLEGDRDNPDGFFWKNPAFSRSDAMAYYCVLRAIRPKRVVEIGAGFSSLVADMAIRRNGIGEIVMIEPYPKPFLRSLTSVRELIEKPVQSIPERELVALIDSCQVWFIDSTHTVKIGSDCLYIYLKIMPQVTSTVMCHSHDVFLPYPMPAQLALEKNIFWTEQYLLQAYLLDNPKVRIKFGSAYVYHQMPEASRHFLRGYYEDGGGSLWYLLNGERSVSPDTIRTP